jgi:hypothetical protein
MYRGSSFLLQHTHTVHKSVIAQLACPRFSPLWEREFGAGAHDEALVPLVMDATVAVREGYSPFNHNRYGAGNHYFCRRTETMKNLMIAGRALCSLLPVIHTVTFSAAQEQQPVASNQAPFVLQDGTPIKLRLSQTVSSADAHVNDRVEFEVLEDVMVNNVVVIPKGSSAIGTVTEAVPKRRMARGGKLEIVLDSVRMVEGEKVALRAVKDAKGGSHTTGMTIGIVAGALVFLPAAPLFLLMHGKDISIPKGTDVPSFVNGDMKLDPAKFQLAQGG